MKDPFDMLQEELDNQVKEIIKNMDKVSYDDLLKLIEITSEELKKRTAFTQGKTAMPNNAKHRRYTILNRSKQRDFYERNNS